MNPFLQKLMDEMQRTKIAADLVAETYAEDASGDAVITLRAESLLLRFTRRGDQEFLEMACSLAPAQFYWYGDIEVAMGWASLERVLAATAPPPLSDVINRLAQHLVELKRIFFKNVELFAQTAIQRTMRQRMPQIKPEARRRI
jgi:hypothetical protein